MSKRARSTRSATLKASSRAIVLTMGLVIQRVFAIAISIYIARILGAKIFGEFTLFVTLFVIFSEIPRAIDNTFIRFANSNVGQKTVGASVHLAVDVLLKLIYALVVITLVNVFATQFSVYIFNKPESIKMLVAGVTIGTLYGVFISLPAFFQQGKHFSRVAALKPLYHALVVGVGFLFISINKTLDLGLILDIHLNVALLLCLVAMLFLVQQAAWRHFLNVKLIIAHTRIASVLALAMLVSLCASRLDVFIIGRLLPLDELGMYGAAVRTAMIASIFTGAIATIMLPQASQAIETFSAYKRYIRLARFYLVMQAMIAVVIVIFSRPILSLLFGVDYEGGAQITVLLVIQTVLTACAVPFRALIQCSAKPSILVFIAMIALCLNGVCMYQVIPVYGVLGAASSMVVTAFIVLLMIIFAAFKLTAKPLLRADLLAIKS